MGAVILFALTRSSGEGRGFGFQLRLNMLSIDSLNQTKGWDGKTPLNFHRSRERTHERRELTQEGAIY
jgi:hypothetical protein